MTTDKTDYHEQQVMNRIFQNSAPDGANDGAWVALWSSSPNNAPSNANEVSGGSYAPVQVPAASWSSTQAAAPLEYDNDQDVSFGTLDTSTQVSIKGVVLYDGSATGTANALWYDDLTSSVTVNAGDEFKIKAGSLTVNED